MQRLFIISGLQAYALVLAFLQSLGGVRTDEAKYLLDIPYPHPPLARWILSQTDWIAHQEMMWRIIFASLLVHSVWLIWNIGKDFSRTEKISLCGLWLFTAAIIFQAGSIMMAPLTALQALLFVWLSKQDVLLKRYPIVVPLVWLCSLFTAYQAVLLAPLVWTVMQKLKMNDAQRYFFFWAPIGLLALYTLINPLVLASMFNHSNRGISDPLSARFIASLRLWMIGGSIVLSLLGTFGMIRAKNWGLLGSMLLVFMYVMLSRYDYYAILFTPLFIGGVLSIPKSYVTVVTHLLVTALFIILYPMNMQMSTARLVMNEVNQYGGTVLINGSFGHEWQYESGVHLKRFSPDLVPLATTIVCLSDCMFDSKDEWILSTVAGADVWISKQ